MKVKLINTEGEATQWFKNGDHPLVRPIEQPIEELEETCLTAERGGGFNCNYRFPLLHHGEIDTVNGKRYVCHSDWIIVDKNNRCTTCRAEVFDKYYAKVEE